MTNFVQNVMQRLDDRFLIVEVDRESVVANLKRLQRQGFTEDQAFRMASCTEEVNPDLSEEVALNRMHKIYEENPKFTKKRRIDALKSI